MCSYARLFTHLLGKMKYLGAKLNILCLADKQVVAIDALNASETLKNSLAYSLYKNDGTREVNQ